MTCCELHPRVMTPEDEARELEGDPLDWVPPEELQRCSEVAAFYDGTAVLLTGATGFVGSLVLEKLLRSCPGVSVVYVLVRDKKGVPLRERLRSHLETVIFSEARKACPDYLRKVVPIAGDCTQPGLGISPDDAAELASKVSVFFHVAATVRFDADLRTATVTNVSSTCEAVALMKRMSNLKAFVYMSTAYSNAPRDEIEEKFYPPGLKAEELLKLIRIMDDEQLAQILPLLLGDWPNTYTFTKAVAEDVVRSGGSGLPVSIIRPSIVSSTYHEPLALWAGNLYGPNAMGLGGAVGVLHAMSIDSNAMADGVPADMVANATIACAWETWCRHSKRTLIQQASAEPGIFNCVSTPRHPISWGQVINYAHHGRSFPSIRNFWVAYLFMFKAKFGYVTGAVLFHLIPAIIADTFLYLKGIKPILWNMYSRIHGASQALEPFTTREWTFKDDNFASLLGRMGAVDRKLFPCDIVDVDWEWFISNTMRGLRLYLLNESFDTLEAARKRYRRLVVVNQTLVATGSALLLFKLWQILVAQIRL
ncbi:fatty acyl-CoA reductase 1-like [Schistocerca piceifrons]|uniref:fatty acyl-CoA reductase 1-like n=1 Tax=Schistocerca piceifrons TaxID=274613 RepID=UPI001F5F5606|nr:fatty acyl-CoA reductase 1-like [Schistocerca piceifrons]XP_047097970.1 fatty acyl-CoA reductase 1-like [Schistocerca piceifrons]